jgi:hypothetical protein
MTMLLNAFSGLSILSKLIAVGIIILLLGTVYGVWHYHVWSNGYEDALAAIAKQDSKAIAKAKRYRSAVSDCDARGLRWDQSTGVCGGR